MPRLPCRGAKLERTAKWKVEEEEEEEEEEADSDSKWTENVPKHLSLVVGDADSVGGAGALAGSVDSVGGMRGPGSVHSLVKAG